jgi:hypothetical protein
MDELDYLTRRANLLGEREAAQRNLDRLDRRIEELDITKQAHDHTELVALLKSLNVVVQ